MEDWPTEVSASASGSEGEDEDKYKDKDHDELVNEGEEEQGRDQTSAGIVAPIYGRDETHPAMSLDRSAAGGSGLQPQARLGADFERSHREHRGHQRHRGAARRGLTRNTRSREQQEQHIQGIEPLISNGRQRLKFSQSRYREFWGTSRRRIDVDSADRDRDAAWNPKEDRGSAMFGGGLRATCSFRLSSMLRGGKVRGVTLVDDQASEGPEERTGGSTNSKYEQVSVDEASGIIMHSRGPSGSEVGTDAGVVFRSYTATDLLTLAQGSTSTGTKSGRPRLLHSNASFAVKNSPADADCSLESNGAVTDLGSDAALFADGRRSPRSSSMQDDAWVAAHRRLRGTSFLAAKSESRPMDLADGATHGLVLSADKSSSLSSSSH